MKKIFENKSLRFICNTINTGLVETEEIRINNLQLISKNKPNFFIRPVEIDISDYIISMIRKIKISSKPIINFETTFYDFVVFSMINQDTLIISSLLELISIAPNLIQNEQQKTEEKNQPIDNIWSLDLEEWDLILEN